MSRTVNEATANSQLGIYEDDVGCTIVDEDDRTLPLLSSFPPNKFKNDFFSYTKLNVNTDLRLSEAFFLFFYITLDLG